MEASQTREELTPVYYFPNLHKFKYATLFQGLDGVWEAIPRLRSYILNLLSNEVPSWSRAIFKLEGARLVAPGNASHGVPQGMLSSEGYIFCGEDIILEGVNIAIGRDTVIEPGVVVKSPAIIGRKAELRHGAYIRGSVIIGDEAVVGHATEVKNAVFMDRAEAGHFAYVGDSILGQSVNLGAGTKLANLELRYPQEKESHAIRPITISIGGNLYHTGLEKLGAILGDNVETGCNSVTSPGALIGPGSWVYANTTVRKGVYGQNMIIRNRSGRMEVSARRDI